MKIYLIGESVPTYIDDLSFFDNIEEILNMKYNPHSTNTKIKYSGMLLHQFAI